MTDRIRRIEPVDRLDFAEGTLVLYERQLVSLSALGAAVFDRAAEPVALGVLADELAAEFGTPPEGSPADATRAIVDALAGLGVLEFVAPPDGP